MPSIEKEQLLAYLEQVYRPIVRRARAGANRDENEREDKWLSAFPSRALTCFFMATFARLTPETTSACDVDGGDDEGIDGFHYDARGHQLFLVQAKAGGDGATDQPGLNDCLRFFDGVSRFLEGDLSRFQELSEAQAGAARAALGDTELKITFALAHFGGSLDEHRTTRAEEIVNRYNRNFATPRMRFVNFNLARAHEAFLRLGVEVEVDCLIKLHSYAKHSGRFECYYGRILAVDLKALHDDPLKQRSLYSRNVRLFRGANPVNRKVKETVLNEPENLFYLNNGVTALCTSFTPTPATAGGRNREDGEFQARGFVIINGAQTIGTIAANLAQDNTTAFVLLRVIVVGDDDEGIGERVAEASNHQTTVENIDFLSMHPCNERIVATLKASGVTYRTKRSLPPAGLVDPQSFTLTEALEARVCSMGEASLLAKIKATPSKFHEEIRRRLETIFPDSLSARTLWREVQICRIADEAIRNTRDGMERSVDSVFFTNGAYFLKSLILWAARELAAAPRLNLTEEESSSLRSHADELLAAVLTIATAHFSPAPNWNHIFKTVSTLQEARRLMLAAMNTDRTTGLPGNDE